MAKPAIIVVMGREGGPEYEDRIYHGVFADGEVAAKWGFRNLQGFRWFWEHIALQTDENGVIELRKGV